LTWTKDNSKAVYNVGIEGAAVGDCVLPNKCTCGCLLQLSWLY